MYRIYRAALERKTTGAEPRGWDWELGDQLEAVALSAERRLNAAPGLRFTLPPSASAVLDINDPIAVLRHGQPFLNGFITDEKLRADGGRDYSALGATTALTKTYFPPEYIYRGWIDSAENRARLTSGYVFRRITSSSTHANDDGTGAAVLTWGGRTSGTGAQIPVLTNTSVYEIQREGFTGGRGVLSLAGVSEWDGIPQPPIVTTGTYASPYIDMRDLNGLPTTLDTIRALYSEGATAEYRLAAAGTNAAAGRAFSGSKLTLPADRAGHMPAPIETAYAFLELTLTKPADAEPEDTAEVYSVDLIGRHALPGGVGGGVSARGGCIAQNGRAVAVGGAAQDLLV